MGKTICLRVKGKVVKETALNSVVCIPVHFICCMSHHGMLRQGPEMRFQSQHLFFLFLSSMHRSEFDFGSYTGGRQGVDWGFEYKKMNV